jgi:ABC-2 type transport system ATP-binding protein
MIEVQSLTRYFGQVLAVNDVSFQVDKGEILGFLGPNAAGKTTTMRILTTFLPATSGTARVAGFDVHEKSMDVRKKIGYLPESPPVYPEMRVKDYLSFVAKIKEVEPKNEKKAIDDALGKTGTTDVSNRVIKTLSKGYKQRVGLAQALVHNPDVLILDEPTVGLDPAQIIEVRELIKGLAGDHTIILSTHILPEVSMTTNRVVIIDKGKVVAEDTPENLTKSLAGSQRFLMTVKGPEVEVNNKISAVAGVEKVKVSKKADYLNVTVETTSDDELSPALAKAIVDNGWDLFEMKPEGMSLEDVFLHVTTKEEESTQ